MYILRENLEDFDSLGNDLASLIFENYDFMLNLTESVMEMVETSMNQEHKYLMSENTSLLNESTNGVFAKLKEMFLNMLKYIKTTIMNIFNKISGRNRKLAEDAKKMQEESDSKDKILTDRILKDKLNQKLNAEINPHRQKLRQTRSALQDCHDKIAKLEQIAGRYTHDMSIVQHDVEKHIKLIEYHESRLNRQGETSKYYEDVKGAIAKLRGSLDEHREKIKYFMTECAEIKETQTELYKFIKGMSAEEEQLRHLISQALAKHNSEYDNEINSNK